MPDAALAIHPVPVVLGSGVRFFGDYAASPVVLDNPEVVEGNRVTHLHYRIRKAVTAPAPDAQNLSGNPA